MSGLSTRVSISFGIALVAGNILVPKPATGIITFISVLLLFEQNNDRTVMRSSLFAIEVGKFSILSHPEGALCRFIE